MRMGEGIMNGNVLVITSGKGGCGEDYHYREPGYRPGNDG